MIERMPVLHCRQIKTNLRRISAQFSFRIMTVVGAQGAAPILDTTQSALQEKPFLISIDRASLMPVEDVARSLETDRENGLTASEAAIRLERFGSNEMSKKAQVNPLQLLAAQFMSTVVILLLIAAVVSFAGGEHLQAAGIVLAVAINALVGFATEYKAQISLAQLEKLAGPVARVRRAGGDSEIPASEIVPGDLLILEEGSRVPADVRLIMSAALSLDESMLSGESIPVYKSSEVDETGEHLTIAFQGTLILKGRAKALVVATGNNTRLGQLGRSLTEIKTKATPLQDDLEKLGKQLSILTISVCLLLFLVGILQGENIWAMVQSSIALAVAAIPEGLPVVATLALATGTNRMVKLGALVRKLSAVETLGSTQVICTDKTGTLTENQMTVTDIVVDSRHFNVSGSGYCPKGELREGETIMSFADCHLLGPLLTAAVLCNDARLECHEEDDTQWHVHGDPTEGALLALSLKAGIEQHVEKKKMPRKKEFVFDLNRKRMTTFHSAENKSWLAVTKGAPETVLALCKTYESKDGPQELTEQIRDWFGAKNSQMARKGLRVLGFATRTVRENFDGDDKDAETDMKFIGLIGMSDRPKEGVRQAVKECRQAGIQVIMLTGDQPATAMAIAQDLDILPSQSDLGSVLTGKEIENLQPDELKEALDKCTVLARVKPEAKLSIVRALQSSGKVVAMTGDGINDAPALQQSDIGVAMGRSGTSLAREASDMVITDDNFPTIVHAVEQGRVIYSNISCAVAYLLTASIASVFTVAASVIFHLGMLLTPLQLLWLNLIMHVFPGLGLVLQEARPGIMHESPRGREQSLLGKRDYFHIIIRGLIVSACSLLMITRLENAAPEKAGTVVLCTISLSLIFQSWSWLTVKRPKDDHTYLTSMPMYVNTALALALLLSAALLAPLQAILATVDLTANEWSAVVLMSLFTYLLSSFVE
jgi:Ca2+-transporting ATPase